MTVTEFKRIINALSAFASVREKASGSESLIGVQSKDGILKLIAGNSTGGVAATAGVGDFEPATFTVLARPLLNAAKVLKGKLDLRWQVLPDGLHLVTDKGGSIICGASGVALKDAGFSKKPRHGGAIGSVAASRYGQISSILDAVQRDIESRTPTIHFYDDKAVITGVSPVNKEMYASLSMPGTRTTEEEVYGSAYMNFWRALKVLDEDGTIEFGSDGMIARSGPFEVFSAPYLVSPWDGKRSLKPQHPKPWPEFGWNDSVAQARVTIARKVLIDAIKGQTPNDEHERVTLQVDTGTLMVHPFGAEDGLSLPAITEGRGVRSVQGPLVLDILRAFDSKEIEMAWGNPAPAIRLNAKEYDSWIILLAPVTMNR